MIFQYETEGRSPKDFRNYHYPIELFKDLRDSNINPKEVLKDQIKIKTNLGEIKTGNTKSKSEDQISVIQNVEFFFWFKRKNYLFFGRFFFFLSEAKYKAKYGKGLKILTPKQMLQRLPIGFSQVKAGNTSEILLNEIKQVICSQEKLLKKYITI